MKGKMNRIVSKDECRELIKPSLSRSNNLYQSSKMLFEKEQYPISYSLFVLSMEEQSKALICLLGSEGIFEIRKRHLYIHKNKQNFIGMLGMLFLIMNWDELPKIFLESLMDPKFKPASEKDMPIELNEKMFNYLNFIVTGSYLKEIGFYADLDEERKAILPENEIDKETFPSFYYENPLPVSNGSNENIFLSNIIEIQKISEKFIPPELISNIFPIPLDKLLNQIKTSVSKSK